MDALKYLDSIEIYPSHIPDLSSRCYLYFSGRYYGKFPDSVEVCGTLADLSNFQTTVIVQNAKDMPLDRVFAGRQINALTAQAWLSGTKQLEEKVTKLSLLSGVPSEYTSMTLVETDKGKLPSKAKTEKEGDIKDQRIIFLKSLGIGFGDVMATADNRSPEPVEAKLYQTSEVVMKVASDVCSKVIDKVCCMCFIRCCSRMNDQCAIALTQLCTILACFECMSVCCEICSGD